MADIPQIGMIGTRLDLLIRQGATFGPFRLTMQNPDGSPVILTDATFRGQIRKTPDALTIEAAFTFKVTDPLMGKVEFEVDAVSTAAIVAGMTETDEDSQYVYDIEYVNEENRVLPLLYGNVSLFREVTK
jgi:hypothetical protein